MSPLQKYLEHILEVCNRATRGGWRASPGRQQDLIIQSKRAGGVNQNIAMMWRDSSLKGPNAEFIVLSRRIMHRMARAVMEADLNLQVIAAKSTEEQIKARVEFTRNTIAHLMLFDKTNDTEVANDGNQTGHGDIPSGGQEAVDPGNT